MHEHLIALRAHGSASITCEEEASQRLPPNHNPAQPTVTNLMMNGIVVPTIPAEPNHMVTSTDGEQQGSSSVEQEPFSKPPTWGAYKQEITPVDLWLAPIPSNQPQYLHRQCFICDAAMATLDPQALLTAYLP